MGVCRIKGEKKRKGRKRKMKKEVGRSRGIPLKWPLEKDREREVCKCSG